MQTLKISLKKKSFMYRFSDDASFVTGEMLVVDGGQTIHGATLQFTT